VFIRFAFIFHLDFFTVPLYNPHFVGKYFSQETQKQVFGAERR